MKQAAKILARHGCQFLSIVTSELSQKICHVRDKTRLITLATHGYRREIRGIRLHQQAIARDDPCNFLKILGYWVRGKKRNKAAYPPKAGPGREEMLRALGLSHEADIVILAQRRAADAETRRKIAA